MTKKSKKKEPLPDIPDINDTPPVHFSVTQRSRVFIPIPHKTKKKMHPRQRALRGRYRIKQTHSRVRRALKDQKKGDRR